MLVFDVLQRKKDGAYIWLLRHGDIVLSIGKPCRTEEELHQVLNLVREVDDATPIVFIE